MHAIDLAEWFLWTNWTQLMFSQKIMHHYHHTISRFVRKYVVNSLYRCNDQIRYIDNLTGIKISLIDCVGVKRHVNPCGSFCVVSQGKGENRRDVEEMKERGREERGTGMKVKKLKK